MSISAHLYRQASSQDGTFGRLILPNSKVLLTGELPWRNNKQANSCIPEGAYICKSFISPRFGKCYTITDVQDRKYILIHPANYCGLAIENKKQELQGCIALGLGTAIVNNQKILTSSRLAITRFHDLLKFEPFTLTIHNYDYTTT